MSVDVNLLVVEKIELLPEFTCNIFYILHFCKINISEYEAARKMAENIGKDILWTYRELLIESSFMESFWHEI